MMPYKEKIIARLQEHWDFLLRLGYNEDRMLGIFAYGSMNYGFYNPKTSDVDSKVIVLPSFEDMCFKKDWFSHEYHYENDEHIEVKDIRLMREMFMKQNINYIEILYSEYFILNPKYEKMFNAYFVSNREYISHYDRNKTVRSIGGQILNSSKFGNLTDKHIYNLYRLYFFLNNYIEDKPYNECINSEAHHDHLWKIKYNGSQIWKEQKDRENSAKAIAHRTQQLMNTYAGIDSPNSKAALVALDAGVTEILKFSFEEHKPESPRKEDFFKQLTNAETKAYYSIVKEIGCEGNITISKLVENNNISRPVYNNLITKMKENKVATVTNMGMKGTYIKITQFELKAEAIDFSKKL